MRERDLTSLKIALFYARVIDSLAGYDILGGKSYSQIIVRVILRRLLLPIIAVELVNNICIWKCSHFFW